MTITEENIKFVDGLNFETFDIVKELEKRKNFCITMTAKRNSGKSVLLKDLCHKIKKWYSQVYVFSLTAALQPDLFDFVKKENIINGFSEEKLEALWKSQDAEVTRLKKMKKDPDDIPKILIIFDDIIASPLVRNSKMLKNIFVAGRHLHFASFFLTQGFKAIPPILRVNTDVALCFHLNSYDDRDAFSKQYLSTKNNKIGMLIFDKITKTEYQALIVLNFKVGIDPQQYIRTYTASLNVPKFSMGNSSIGKKVFHGDLFPSSGMRDVDFIPRIKNIS